MDEIQLTEAYVIDLLKQSCTEKGITAVNCVVFNRQATNSRALSREVTFAVVIDQDYDESVLDYLIHNTLKDEGEIYFSNSQLEYNNGNSQDFLFFKAKIYAKKR